MESGDWGAVPEALGDFPSASENGQPSLTDSASTSGLFAGGGEVGALMGQVDWSSTPLGPVETWPQSLQTVVRILLSSRFAMWMGWGPDLTFLYNDTYGRVTLGKKHPWALGKPAREVWSEIWSDIGPRVQRVLDGGGATWDEALLLFLERSGYREETYHTFSYSPLSGDDGRIMGLLCVVTEETDRVIGERRLSFLRALASAHHEGYYEPSKLWIHANAYPSPDGLSIFAQDVTERRLQQEKLLLSEKLAATGRLAATIAHEINNPLESVLNLIYLARTSPAEISKIREYLETAEKELNRVSHIARHTLGFYRETSVASDVDLPALIEEVLTVYDSRLRASSIVAVLDFAVVPAVHALRGELHQTFSNLISNAIDAMRDSGGQLKYRFSRGTAVKNPAFSSISRTLVPAYLRKTFHVCSSPSSRPNPLPAPAWVFG